MAAEISSNRQHNHSPEDNSDEDDEDAGWLSQSQFDLPTTLGGAPNSSELGGFDVSALYDYSSFHISDRTSKDDFSRAPGTLKHSSATIPPEPDEAEVRFSPK